MRVWPVVTSRGCLMSDRAAALKTALHHMQEALELLDEMGANVPALHLQMAIDTLTNVPIPRTIEDADEALAAPEVRGLVDRLEGRPWMATRDFTPAEPSPAVIDRAAELVRLHGNKALGRTRMQLYEAMGRRETAEVNHLAQVCAVLLQAEGRA